ncbi:MAG: DciA family protein [Armatimonadota bacterium]|nr:DciA family protein [Armatimonadota bacterium]
MAVICPFPVKWSEIYRILDMNWREAGGKGLPPPIPLILAGWFYSNDVEKKARWDATMAWAESRGFSHLIPQLSEGDTYIVNELTNHEVGPMGGPMYLLWSFTPKTKPLKVEVDNAFGLLRDHWGEIVGTELAQITRPLRLTGRKYRRLLVQADANVVPTWGSWSTLHCDERRRSFTQFRRAVNEAIKPLYVDHVDFVVLGNTFPEM